MAKPVPPRPGHRPPVIEENVASGPHTPPPPDASGDTTAPPPAPDRRPPPKQYARRGSVSGVLGPVDEIDEVDITPEPIRRKLDSMDVAVDHVLEQLMEERRSGEELRRQLREMQAAHHVPNIEQPHQLPSSAPPKYTDWAKAVFALMGAVTLTLGSVGTYLGARAASQDGKVDHVAAVSSAQKIIVAPLPQQVAEAVRGTAECRRWAREDADYNRQVFRAAGIYIPEPENAPPATPIKTVARLRKPNAVTGAPILEVLTPQPDLP